MRFVKFLPLPLLILFLFSLSLVISPVSAQQKLDKVKEEIEELQKKLAEVQSEKQSLSQTINFLNTKVSLAEAQIVQTEAEIAALKVDIDNLQGKIGVLDVNLEKISAVLVNRISASYKNSHNQPMMVLLLSNQFSDFFRTYKYLKVSQQHDREVIFALEEARTSYDTQKQVKEEKQTEVEALQQKLLAQKSELDVQKQAKQAALRVTQNDEIRYQSQLAKARAELEAIQSIIAGKGDETKVGEVKVGARIASVIPGPSTCSNGGHLHLEVAKDGIHHNPAAYLSPKDVIWDNKPDGSFSFSGSWPWPLKDPIRITQGYGMTFYAGTLRYYGGAPHTGIDMVNNSDFNVRSVADGTLYRGAIACGGGLLRYVRVEHKDDVSSYYLHVNY